MSDDEENFPQPLGTGHMILAERDRTRPPRKRGFPFGFGLPVSATLRYATMRNRHRGSVARRQP